MEYSNDYQHDLDCDCEECETDRMLQQQDQECNNEAYCD
jgi:hypothetical protein